MATKLSQAPDEIKQTPIIDTHTHTFNARYLPLRGITQGKRDAHLFGMLLSDRGAVRVSEAIARSAHLTDFDGGWARSSDSPISLYQTIATSEGTSTETVSTDPGVRCVVDYMSRYEDALAKLMSAKTNAGARATILQNEDLSADWSPEMSDYQIRKAAYEIAASKMTDSDLKEIRKALALAGFAVDIPTVKRFLLFLVSADGDLPWLFQDEFDNKVSLMVSHMMDLAPVYDQPPDKDQLLDFETEQIRRMKLIQEMPDSKEIFFVAYNPFRDNWLTSNTGSALRIVQTAITEYGAYGVKVYPPSGYRPTKNAIPKKPHPLFTKKPREQWEARYKGRTPESLDSQMEELLLWCESNDTPVFAHCSTGEFEARKDYGKSMANPAYWKEYLEKHSTPERKCQLRLCLGHAGGATFWFGGKDYADWGATVMELCETYPNVYCEMGVHEQVVDDKQREYFIAHMERLFKDSRDRDVDHPFETKIMYGSDWFMPGSVFPQVDYLYAYQLAFLDERLVNHYRRFFFENAWSYLNSAARVRKQITPASVKSRLEGIHTTPRQP